MRLFLRGTIFVTGALCACDGMLVQPHGDDGFEHPDASTSRVDGAPQGEPADGDPNSDPIPPALDAGHENAKITIVNAVTDLGPGADLPGTDRVQGVRLCFGIGPSTQQAQIAGIPPLPDESNGEGPAGILAGRGETMRGLGLDFSPFVLVPYLMNANQLALKGIVKPGPGDPGTPCDEILSPGAKVGGHTFTENVDYWKLEPISAQTFAKGKSFVLLLTGCSRDGRGNAATCGGDAPTGDAGRGNLQARAVEVDRLTPIPAHAAGVQFIHASPGAAAHPAMNSGGIRPGFVNAPDPQTNSFVPLAPGAPLVSYGERTPLAILSGISFASDYFTAQRASGELATALETIQSSSFPHGLIGQTGYRNGAAFTFIALGDPAEGSHPTRGFHYLGFPNDPWVEMYKP
jgi:hypothetical protein